MPAIAAAGVVFFVVQLLFAGFVYREAAAHDRRSPPALALFAFVASMVTVVVTDSPLFVLALQAFAIGVYFAALPRDRRRIPN